MTRRLPLRAVAEVRRLRDRAAEQAVEADDVIVTLTSDGVDVAVGPSEDPRTGVHRLLLRPLRDGTVTSSWLALYCRSTEFRSLLDRHARGRTIRSVPVQEILDFEVPVPDLDLQHAAELRVKEMQVAVDAQRALVAGLERLQRATERLILEEALASLDAEHGGRKDGDDGAPAATPENERPRKARR